MVIISYKYSNIFISIFLSLAFVFVDMFNPLLFILSKLHSRIFHLRKDLRKCIEVGEHYEINKTYLTPGDIRSFSVTEQSDIQAHLSFFISLSEEL